jgi:hypothetical protein
VQARRVASAPFALTETHWNRDEGAEGCLHLQSTDGQWRHGMAQIVLLRLKLDAAFANPSLAATLIKVRTTLSDRRLIFELLFRLVIVHVH